MIRKQKHAYLVPWIIKNISKISLKIIFYLLKCMSLWLVSVVRVFRKINIRVDLYPFYQNEKQGVKWFLLGQGHIWNNHGAINHYQLNLISAEWYNPRNVKPTSIQIFHLIFRFKFSWIRIFVVFAEKTNESLLT